MVKVGHAGIANSQQAHLIPAENLALSSLSLKTIKISTIYMNHSVGGDGEAADVHPERRYASAEPFHGQPLREPHRRD